jgi:hypothetical protein
VILLATGLRLFSFWHSYELPPEALTPLSSLLFTSIWEHLRDHRLMAGLALLLILLQAIYFNSVINRHSLLYKNTYIPAAVYVIICSLDTGLATLYPQLVANIFLLFFLNKIFSLPDTQNPVLLLFDAGMMIALASLFSFETVLIFPFLIYAVALIRPFHWREYAVSCLGLLIPYYFTIIIFYLADRHEFFYAYYRNDLFNLQMNRIYMALPVLVPLSVLGVILAFSFGKLLANYYKNMIKIRIFQQLLLFFLVITILLFFLNNIPSFRSIIFTAAPISVFVAYYFLGDKRIWMKNLLFITLIGSIVYFQLI